MFILIGNPNSKYLIYTKMKIYKYILFTIITLFFSSVTNAQVLKVESFEKDLTDVTACSNAVKDGNGDTCALVKISLPVTGCEFSGNIVGKPEFHVSEYWVYMTPSSKKLIVRCPGCKTLQVDLKTNEGKVGVESAVTYQLELSGYSNTIAFSNNQIVQTNKDAISPVSTSSNTINGHDYVDLGLPSGVKWATCNVGASSPSDYGDYFAWGETMTKSEYTKENSKTDEKNIEDISGNAQYDAARANWGGSWRIPTKTECEELKDKCTWIWATQDKCKGYMVTGPNGKSIFLPAVGWRYGASLSGTEIYGDYWTSTPSDRNSHVSYYVYFKNDSYGVSWEYRNFGYPIRPVSD